MLEVQLDTKQRITIRLDAQIIEFYKNNFENYQTAINDALKSIIQTQSIQSIAQQFYSKLKKLKKNRFNEFNGLTNTIDINKIKLTFNNSTEIFATIKTIMPDFLIDIEDLNNDFLKQDDFAELLFEVYLIRQLGEIVAEDIGAGTNDCSGAVALGIAFLGIRLDDLINYLSREFYVTTDNDTLLEEWSDWDSASESNSELLALGSLQQSSEKISDDYLEYKIKINTIINIYNYHQMTEKEKSKYNIKQDYENFLQVMYTNIAYNSQNYGGGYIGDIPDFLIFKLVISDLVKLISSKDADTMQNIPDYLFTELGFVWDISVFEIPTKATPILGLTDNGCFFIGDIDEPMNYAEAYKPHLLELLEVTTDEETREILELTINGD